MADSTIEERVTDLETKMGSYGELLTDIKSEQKITHDKLDEILSIRVNGKAGLAASLKDLYDLTYSIRVNKKLENSFDDWLKIHPIINNIIKSWVFKIVVGMVILYLFTGLLKFIGVSINFQVFLDNLKSLIPPR